MKLIKCHIENFGTLSKVDYDFKDGLNTIKKENGAGKTTFASFIKAMFYGMEIKRNTKVLIDRKKYEPWQGGAFGGSIEFEINNKEYKLERFFGKKEADDIFKLYDLSTNLESQDYTENIGEEIFKLNKEAYERSTFISGQNMETGMNDSISAKLGNILENENDINSSEQAIKSLDEAIKNYKKTGGRGEINEKIYKKTLLEKKLEQSKIDEKTYQERKKKYNELKQALEEKEKEQESFKKLLELKTKEEARQEAKKAKLENYKILQSNVKESFNTYEQYKNTVSINSELSSKIELNEEKLKKVQEEKENIENKTTKIKNNIKILFAIATIFFIIGIICFVCKKNIVAILGLIVGIGSFGVAIYKSILSKNINNICLNLVQEKQNIENNIETFKSLYEKEVSEKEKELTRLKNDYELKLKLKEDFEKNNDIDELKNIKTFEGIDINIEAKVQNLEKEIGELKDEKNYNKNQIEVIESELESVFDVENELEELNDQIEEMQENVDILEKTKKYLEIAKEQFSSQYLSGMKNSFIKNIKAINGKDMDINLDVNLDVKINEQGSSKKLGYFSTGYRDLIYICMRISLIEALFENEKPFIILDDPFVNLDEEKIENALKLLNSISENYQTIYFICHKSRE